MKGQRSWHRQAAGQIGQSTAELHGRASGPNKSVACYSLAPAKCHWKGDPGSSRILSVLGGRAQSFHHPAVQEDPLMGSLCDVLGLILHCATVCAYVHGLQLQHCCRSVADAALG